jgi:hypothetical protein
MASNAQLCYNTGSTASINYNGLPIIQGNIVYANSSDFKTFGCYEITDVDATGSTINAQIIYENCYDCLNENYGVVNFQSCGGAYTSLQAPISSFGVIPSAGEVFYGTFDVNTGEGVVRITSCWVIDRENPVTMYTQSGYNRLLLSPSVSTPTSQDGCEECFLANATTYSVRRCTDEAITDYVLLLSGYSGNTISYTDDTNIYCGVVGVQIIGAPEWTFVSDYGNPGEGGNFCEDCLSASNQKILLESCTDPRNQLVVWSSTLFGIGDYSHLSTDDGCFRVVGPTTDEISSPYFLNFVPSPGCDPCIECNGIAYEYSTCSEEPITGTVYLYQYLPSGTTYFDPYQQACTTIGNITTGSGDYTLYSVNTFNDCPDCVDFQPIIELWYGTICETGQDIYVTTVSSAGLTAGNVVKAMWGSNEYVCVQLDSTVPGTDSSIWYDTKKDSLGNTELYDGCTTCISSSNIVVGLIKCGTNEESFVTISLSNYLSIIGNGFTLPNYTIRDQRQNCYTITSVCPQPSSASTESMSVAYFFYSCQYCPDQIITSANTEYNTCVICCECGSTGSTVNSVSTPHPIYTDGYNNPIMQLNMVVLGGPNGLNS